jgi:hypothetical protein
MHWLGVSTDIILLESKALKGGATKERKYFWFIVHYSIRMRWRKQEIIPASNSNVSAL